MKKPVEHEPRFARWLLFRLSMYDREFSFRGDIGEEYTERANMEGVFSARKWYLGQVVHAVPAYIKFTILWSLTMFKNYMKIAFRNLRRQKFYTLVNISGLCIGIALFILAMLYAEFNLSFDKFHDDYKEIFLVTGVLQNDRHLAYAPAPLYSMLQTELPDVEHVSRYLFSGEMAVRYEDNTFNEGGIRFVDDAFLDILTFNMIYGDPATALSQPNSVVLTDEMADKYFGAQNPIGKTLVFEDSLAFQVTGVVKKAPRNSSIQFNFLIPNHLRPPETNWSTWRLTLLRLPKGVDRKDIEQKIASIVDQNYGNPEYKPKTMYLFPFHRIYFRPPGLSAPFNNTPMEQFFLIIGTAAALLLVVCLNFMNLATARYMNRAREVGLRKVVGAERQQLIKQFLGESILISFIALPLGLLLYMVLRLPFQTMMRLDLDLFVWSSPKLIVLTVFITLCIGLISGSYPAFFLSAFRTTNILRGTFTRGKKGARGRRILVVSQFVLSVVLIIFSITVRRQFAHLLTTDLGFSRENVIALRFHRKGMDKMEIMENELLNHPDVISVARSQYIPVDWGSHTANSEIIPEGMGEESKVRVEDYPAPVDFIETLKMRIIKGRSFSRDFNEANSCIVSETTARMLPWEDAVGKRITWGEWTATIIGVVEDFHFNHVFYEMLPTLLFCPSQQRHLNYLLVRTAPGTSVGVQEWSHRRWQDIRPDIPLETLNLDDRFVERFKDTVKGGELIEVFSSIAIFFSCLGLLGLASYTVERKSREIALRKVLGATVKGLTTGLIYRFLLLVALSNCIALPLGYFASHWFINWAWVSPIALGIDIFMLATGISLTAALIAVTSQSLRAALANPVDALRIE